VLIATFCCIAQAIGPAMAAPEPAGEPLWSFAAVADMHFEPSRQAAVVAAFSAIDAQLKPRFVMFLGDNSGYAPPQAVAPPPAADAQREPLGLRRQRFLKAFLDEHLKTPSVLIPGDNWPEDFEKVFGPFQYSFDFGGLHFLMLAPDRSCRQSKMEGLAVFDRDNLAWISRDLDRSRGRPTIVALHSPCVPPTFLDAIRLSRLLAGHPQVIAVFQGHLHVDGQWPGTGCQYLVFPSLGKTSPPAFKQVLVYPDRLELRTFGYNARTSQFEQAERRQEIAVPESLRGGVVRPAPGFQQANYDCVPAHPHLNDPDLVDRGSLLQTLLRQVAPEQ